MPPAQCGRGGTVDATDLSEVECSSGNRGCRTAQIRRNLLTVATPSQAPRPNGRGEGVRTRRAAPNRLLKKSRVYRIGWSYLPSCFALVGCGSGRQAAAGSSLGMRIRL